MDIRNREIRQLMFDKRVKYWEVAEALNMTDTTFSKKLRRELPEEEKWKIKDIINKISKLNK